MLTVNHTRLLERMARSELRKRMKARRLMARKTGQSQDRYESFVTRVDAHLARLQDLIDAVEETRRELRSKK